MQAFEHALILLLLIASLSVIGHWLPWPAPITYLVGGVVAAYVPGFPELKLDPGFFFLCFLPPLLFADGWLMPLREFVRARRQILRLAIGLVLFTTVAVALMAHWLVPALPLGMAFALGAIVSPTDAVAVNAIIEKMRVPTRLSTILNGESLMNDATGLVAFKFALAAVVAGGFSLMSVAGSFALLAVGGFAVGLLLGYLVGVLRDTLRRLHTSDPLVQITLSLMTPYAAYLAAESLGLSAILSVVAAGLYSGWRDPVKMDVETRQTAFTVWGLLLYWLNGIAFVLLGLQFPSVFAAVATHYPISTLAGWTAGVAGTAIAARLVWIFAGVYLPFVTPGFCAQRSRPSYGIVIGWAGMRGTVTLAGALSIPLALPSGIPFPGRDVVIFLAFGVIGVTLLVQGTTMAQLIRRLGLREDDGRVEEERLARTTAVESGLRQLRAFGVDGGGAEELAALGQVVAEYEHRLAALGSEGETRASARRRRRAGHRFRLAALRAEREALDALWSSGQIADEVHRPLQQLLDHEEAMLTGAPPPADP